MYKAAEDTLGIRKAIRQWFSAYALVDIEGTTLENDILSAIKGEKRLMDVLSLNLVRLSLPKRGVKVTC